MSFRFKPEDFSKAGADALVASLAASAANRILDEHVSTLPEVLGVMRLGEMIWQSELDRIDQMRGGIKRARLWVVEELKQKKCEHTIVEYNPKAPLGVGRCGLCRTPLVARWEELSRELSF